MFGFDFESVTV